MPRTSVKESFEPELVMPSIHEDSVEGFEAKGFEPPLFKAASHLATSRSNITNNSEAESTKNSIHEDAVDGSWLGVKSKSPRQQVRKRAAKSSPQPARGPGRPAANARKAQSQKNSQQDDEEKTAGNFAEGVFNMLQPTLWWFRDVLGNTLRTLKTPISYILAAYLLLRFVVFLRGLLFSSVYSALSPICQLPGSSYLNLPMCHSTIGITYKDDGAPLVEFDQLMTVQSKFEEVLEESAGGVSLPLDMKRGETSIRDLRQVVRFSHLHSKNELVLEFDGFIETARIASYDLQKFNSHVGRAVDTILSTARWTQHVLDDMFEQERSRGALHNFVNAKILAPLQPLDTHLDILNMHRKRHISLMPQQLHGPDPFAQLLQFRAHSLQF